jgi:hypothetical protein
VITLHPRITQKHTALLARWLSAGQKMGLCDAHAYSPKRNERGRDHVLVWVRENPDPAYMIQAEGQVWVITDLVRKQVLVSKPSFAAALYFIRPVLSLEVAA